MQIATKIGILFVIAGCVISDSSARGQDTDSPRDLRILAYNIKHGRGNDGKVDLARTADVIRRLKPDVVALQEVDDKAERSGKVDEAKKLSELTGLKHHAFGKFFDFDGGEYGMAILSRFPLSDVTNLRLPDGAEPRTSLVVTVAAPQPYRMVPSTSPVPIRAATTIRRNKKGAAVICSSTK